MMMPDHSRSANPAKREDAPESDDPRSPEEESLMVGSARLSLPKLQIDEGEGGRAMFGGGAYEGDRPITAQKSYQELVDTLRAQAAASIPANLLESFLGGGEILLGFFVEDGADSLRSELLLEGGQLLTNGVPNPILAMMAPHFEAPIDWDAHFISLREGLESAAGRDED